MSISFHEMFAQASGCEPYPYQIEWSERGEIPSLVSVRGNKPGTVLRQLAMPEVEERILGDSWFCTGRFTKEAKEESMRQGVPPIDLVDGERLVDLFEKYKLGLKARTVYEIEEGFFEEYR